MAMQYKSEAYSALYKSLSDAVSGELADYYYDAGYESFTARDYEAAIPNLQRAYQNDDRNVNALFYMGLSCYRSGHYSEAKEAFAEVIEEPTWRKSIIWNNRYKTRKRTDSVFVLFFSHRLNRKRGINYGRKFQGD